jgi:hypothetical protein
MRLLIILLIVFSGCKSVSKTQTKDLDKEKLVFKGEIKNLYSMDRGFFSLEESQERVIKTPVVLTVNGVEVVAHQEETIRASKKKEEVSEVVNQSEDISVSTSQSKKVESIVKTVEKKPIEIPTGKAVLILLVLGAIFAILKKLKVI